jgi:DNA-directed RNA polymerase subunit alpha
MISLPIPPKVIRKEGNEAVFEIEGLYPGYGLTLGNALRRALLSSLPGAAVVSVKIKGADHEFSTLPFVIEDVVELILNLKEIRFKIYGSDPQMISLKAKGEKEVKAGDFETPSQVEIVNPQIHIATLTDKRANLEIEAVVEKGWGYVPTETRKKEKLGVGSIAVDAIFAPIKKINYEVENMRVGDRTDYNRLRLHIETDGTISPEEALKQAARILVNQFGVLAESSEEEAKEEEEAASAKPKKETEGGEVSKTEIEDMKLSLRTVNVLTKNGVRTAGGLVRYTEKGLKELEGMGDAGVKEIKKALKKLGLGLKEEKE